MSVLSVLLLTLQIPVAPALRPPPAGSFVVEPPCPRSGAGFGHGVAALDMDGDGSQDLAVGAFGEGLVYVFFGRAQPTAMRPFRLISRTFSSAGPESCGAPASSNQLGYDMVGGQLDQDPFDELIVGAPTESVASLAQAGSVYLYGGPGGSTPLQLVSPIAEPGLFGSSVCLGDFDGDGHLDLAVSAPQGSVAGVPAGRVFIYPGGPLNPTGPVIELVNPFPVVHGNFGHHLAVGDTNFDGIDDLIVGAIGNTAQGVPVAGQVFCFPGPLQQSQVLVIEDPNPDPNDLPAPRYSMHVDAREHFVAVGANRTDHSGSHDAGMGYVQSGPFFQDTTLHVSPNPSASDYLGFRCLIGDFVNDGALDFAFLVLLPRSMLIWDGNNLSGPPTTLQALPNSADHLGNGCIAARLVPGGREQIVLGDPTYDVPSPLPANTNTGRVVLYFLP